MEALGINLGYLLTQICGISALILILTAFVYKPILRVLDQRKARIAKGLEEGATLLAGGRPDAPDHGYYVKPVIFTDVTNDMTIAREEIFGPVLSVIAYDTADEALAIANDTPYGLNAAVWGPDKEEASKVAAAVLSGNVYVNDSPRDVTAPFGGFKDSGIGREGGKDGMLEFTEPQAIFYA